MKTKHILLAGFFVIIFSGLTWAISEDDLPAMPGYIDIDDIEVPEDAGEVAEINLTPELIRLASASLNSEDTAFNDALSGLYSIRVKAFEFNDPGQAEQLKPVVDRINQQLEYDNWHNIVKVRDGEEHTVVSVKFDNDKVAGLFVMAYESSEVAFINIVGDLDLGKMVGLLAGMEGIDMEELEKLMQLGQAADQ